MQFQRSSAAVFDLLQSNAHRSTDHRERIEENAYFNDQQPVRFRLKRLDLIVAIDAEAERRRLTRPVRNTTAVQITVLALEVTRLKASEGTTDAQIEFLSRIDGQRLILVRRAEIVEGLSNVFVSDRTEFRPKNLRLNDKSKLVSTIDDRRITFGFNDC